MSDEIETDPETKTESPAVEAKVHDPVHTVTKVVLFFAITLFVLNLVTDRLAPWTDLARINTYVVPVVPQVSGNVIEINVENDQIVKAGDVLFKIDPADYQLAVESAESSLELAGNQIGADTASVTTAQAKLVESKVNLDYVKAESKRVFELEKDNVLSVSEGDKARAAIKKASSQVDSARAGLEKAKQQLGEKGNDNPKIRSALAALTKARVDLSRTTVIAPSKGGITNLVISEGQYAGVGSPLMTFIAFDSVWVIANFRENSIANIQVGDDVDLALDVAPGKIFKGTINSIGFAVEDPSSGGAGQLITVKGKSGWLRDSQRFPVSIKFNDDGYPKDLLRMGGQVDVQVYTKNSNNIINKFGWFRIRALSWISYVY